MGKGTAAAVSEDALTVKCFSGRRRIFLLLLPPHRQSIDTLTAG